MREASAGTKAFRIIYGVLLAAALGAAAFGLIRLWSFFEVYEREQPVHAAEQLAYELNSGVYDRLFADLEISVSPYETEEDYKNAVISKINGEVSVSKSAKESRTGKPVYALCAGGEAFAYAALSLAGKTDFDIDRYELSHIYGITVPAAEYVTITAPSRCSVSVNGVTVREDELKKTDSIAGTALFAGYLTDPPTMNTYRLSGLINQPKVVVTNSREKILAAEYDEEKHSYSVPFSVSDTALAADAEAFALEFSHLYSEYIAADAVFDSIAAYIPPETDLYYDLSNYQNRFYTWHSDFDFLEDKIVQTAQFSEECFSVRVSYIHRIYYGGEWYEFPADNTIYLVQSGEFWQVVNIVMN